MEKQEKLSKEIKQLSDSIRRKTRALKHNISERDAFIESTFKPVVVPLQEISKKLTLPDLERSKIMPAIQQVKMDTSLQKSEKETKQPDNGEDGEEEEYEDEEEMEEEEQDEKEMSDSMEVEEETNIVGDKTPSRLSIIGRDIGTKGLLTRKYVLKMLHSSIPKRKYHVYGARLENDGLMIGDSKITIDNSDNIFVKDNKFKGTAGLFELIFTNAPKNYTIKDLDDFKSICKLTHAHRKNYMPNSGIHRNSSTKYKNVIAYIFPTGIASPSGRGMKNLRQTNVIYYNDVNDLVNRMRLLYEAKNNGHSGLDNEFIALTEELRHKGYIL